MVNLLLLFLTGSGKMNNELESDDERYLIPFLDYLSEQMNNHPELIVEADYDQLKRIDALVNTKNTRLSFDKDSFDREQANLRR